MDNVAKSPALKKLEAESDLKKPTSPKEMVAPAGPKETASSDIEFDCKCTPKPKG